MTVTLEDNYIYNDRDMGTNHIKAHAGQRVYMQPGETEIITLSSNDVHANSDELILKVAIANGVKTKSEWEDYNKGLRKSRQKNNYDEYLTSLSANLTKNKKRFADTKNMPKAKRDVIYRELNSIEKNKLGVTGNLFYLSNVDDYEKQKDLKKYREFERDTFETFYKSDTFKKLHPQNVRTEIHLDEKGATHMQLCDLWMYKDAKGRVSSARRKIIKDILISDYGSEDALNVHLDVLSMSHKMAKSSQNSKNKYRADVMYNFLIRDDPVNLLAKEKFKASASERNARIEELWRIENMNELKDIAVEKAKQYGIDYDIASSNKYQTDGVHRSASEYEAHRKTKKKNDELDKQQAEIDKQQAEIDEQKAELDKQKAELAKRKLSFQEEMNKAMQRHNQDQHKFEQEKKEFEREKQNRQNEYRETEKMHQRKLLNMLSPKMDDLKLEDALETGSIMRTTRKRRPDNTIVSVDNYMSVDEYIGLKIGYLKALRKDKEKPKEQRVNADTTLTNVQTEIVKQNEEFSGPRKIDWNKRFGVDPEKLSKPVARKVRKQKQKDDDLEL